MMSFAAPVALLLLLPLVGGSALFWRAARNGAGLLPGDWSRLVAPPLRAALARKVTGRDRSRFLTAAAAAGCLVVSLAEPRIERAEGNGYANLAGRVIVIDLPPGAEAGEQKRAAAALVASAPEFQTALVAVSADAFDVTPTTLDPATLRRYLDALSPDVMPTAGRDPRAGVMQAEAALDRAGIVAGQVVLFVAAEPPPDSGPPPEPRTDRARVIVAPEAEAEGWAGVARSWGATLVTSDELASVETALRRAREDARRRVDAETGGSLAPWFIGLAMLFWLGLFRRRGA